MQLVARFRTVPTRLWSARCQTKVHSARESAALHESPALGVRPCPRFRSSSIGDEFAERGTVRFRAGRREDVQRALFKAYANASRRALLRSDELTPSSGSDQI